MLLADNWRAGSLKHHSKESFSFDGCLKLVTASFEDEHVVPREMLIVSRTTLQSAWIDGVTGSVIHKQRHVKHLVSLSLGVCLTCQREKSSCGRCVEPEADLSIC